MRCTTTELSTSDGRDVLVMRVGPGEHVHETTKGDVYLRVGDESRKLGYTQRRAPEFDRGSAPFDGTAVGAEVAELDTEQVTAYQGSIGSQTPEGMMAARDLLTRDGRLTVAGWLLFAERPQVLHPSAVVRIRRYAGTERGTGTRMSLHGGGDVRCEGSIPEQIAEAATVIQGWTPKVQALAPSGRFEPRPLIPTDAWLEGLVNAVLHRSYSIAGDHVRVCSDLGIASEPGEGIKRIFTEMRTLGLTDPIYSQGSGSVRLVLSSADALDDDVRTTLSTAARQILDVLRLEARPLSTGQVADLAGIARPTASRHLKTLRELELVAWDGQGPRDPRASWTLR